MYIFCRENDSAFKADVRITEDGRFTIHVFAPTGDDAHYEEIGKHGQPLYSHSTYSVLYKEDGFQIRDRANVQYRSKIKIVPTNQITMGSRMKYEEVENRYGGMVLMQIDTNTVSGSVIEMQIQLYRLQKTNVNFYLRPKMTTEYVDLNMDEVFSKGSKRHKLWDTYSITVDGNEYKASEWNHNVLGVVNMKQREYVDVYIQKYSNDFENALERDADNEDVFIECTAGIANCQRVKLVNGKAKFRWYNLGYEGEFKIKLGWRWYSGVADVKLMVTQ